MTNANTNKGIKMSLEEIRSLIKIEKIRSEFVKQLRATQLLGNNGHDITQENIDSLLKD